jgi:16S rRNA processing protein RimM
MPDFDDMVLVGRISRPHGLRGHVVVNPETDFADERFVKGATLWTRSDNGDEALTIAEARIQGRHPIVRFDGVEKIEDVDRWSGRELRVPEAALPALGEGMYYHHQLIGCVVESTGGKRIGEVARVEGGASGSLLVIDGPKGEILIPLAEDITTGVDVDARRITVNPPEGLLELNEKHS